MKNFFLNLFKPKEHLLSLKTIQIVQSSYRSIKPTATEYSLYKKLSIENLNTPKFSSTQDTQTTNYQIKQLQKIINIIVNNISNIDILIPSLSKIANKKNLLLLNAKDYHIIGFLLLQSLEENLGEEFNSDIENAWLDTYDLVTSIMLDSTN